MEEEEREEEVREIKGLKRKIEKRKTRVAALGGVYQGKDGDQ